MCVIDTGTTVMRVNQPKLRKEQIVELPSSPSQHERAELQSESTDKDHSVPPAYWVGPQHATVDVLELSDGLSLFSSICN